MLYAITVLLIVIALTLIRIYYRLQGSMSSGVDLGFKTIREEIQKLNASVSTEIGNLRGCSENIHIELWETRATLLLLVAITRQIRHDYVIKSGLPVGDLADSGPMKLRDALYYASTWTIDAKEVLKGKT